MSDEIKSLDDLKSTIAEIKRGLGGKAESEKLEHLGRAVDEIKTAQKAINEERIALHRSRRESVHASESEIVRAYTPTAADEISKRSVGDAAAPLSYRKGVTHYGNEDGVVRMLGSEDAFGEWEPGLLDDPAPKSDWQRTAQRMVDDLSMYRAVTGRPAPKLTRRLVRHLQRGPEAIRRVFADNSGEGGEFIADVLLPELLSEMRAPVTLASNFRRVQSNVGGTSTNPFLTTGCQPFLVGVPASGDLDPADLPKSVPSTASRTFSPSTLAVSLPVNRDASEDSIVEFGAFGRMLVVDALRDGEEDALINGDTAGTHGDSGLASWAGPNSRWGVTGHANDHRKAWIGLRHRGLDVSGANGNESGTETAIGAMLWRANLNTAHKGLDGLMYIMPIDWIVKKLLVDTASVHTVDKYGPMASVLTGEIARLGGIPVVTSEYLSIEMNTSGVFDNSTKTKTGALLVNRSRFEFVERRSMRVEVEARPTQHTDYIVASMRETFRTHDGSSTKNLYYAYNLTP